MNAREPIRSSKHRCFPHQTVIGDLTSIHGLCDTSANDRAILQEEQNAMSLWTFTCPLISYRCSEKVIKM